MKAELTDLEKGYMSYTRRSLTFYDWWVLGISNRWIWKCPTEEIVKLYQEHISDNHLEVGVGTGYFLEKVLPVGKPRVALLDINRDCLEVAGARISEYRPEIYQENVLEPFPLPGAGYDSIAINYLLHCLPGNLEIKAGKVMDHLAPYLHDQGTLFGSTILGANIKRPLAASLLMKLYNKKGVFSNSQDSLGAVMGALSTRFKAFNVEVHGCVVLFWGKGIRDSYRQKLKGA
ncbi:MAG: class I SAM-dependent methyltransferase [Verrucomicrobiales bacterium]|nr:class I SAM-dependent methyltransferase [Verrucomicrobiales bacterium]